MTALVALLVSSSSAAASSSCDALSTCHACITHAGLTSYKCGWCTLDNTCYAIGSSGHTKCAGKAGDKSCISLSGVSSCESESVDQCPATAALPEQVHLALAGADGMRVSWMTHKAVAASVVPASADEASAAAGALAASTCFSEYAHAAPKRSSGGTPRSARRRRRRCWTSCSRWCGGR